MHLYLRCLLLLAAAPLRVRIVLGAAWLVHLQLAGAPAVLRNLASAAATVATIYVFFRGTRSATGERTALLTATGAFAVLATFTYVALHAFAPDTAPGGPPPGPPGEPAWRARATLAVLAIQLCLIVFLKPVQHGIHASLAMAGATAGYGEHFVTASQAIGAARDHGRARRAALCLILIVLTAVGAHTPVLVLGPAAAPWTGAVSMTILNGLGAVLALDTWHHLEKRPDRA